MWMDAVIALPLLCFALVECIDKKKRFFLIIIYAYLFISCFYTGYMVGVFSLVYVLGYVFFVHEFDY